MSKALSTKVRPFEGLTDEQKLKDLEYKIYRNQETLTELALADKPIILIEKSLDELVAHQIDLEDYVVIHDKERFFKYENLDKVKKFVIAFSDNKRETDLDADEFARRLGKVKCWKVKWPTEFIELSSFASTVATKGADVAMESIETAKPWPIEGIFDIDEIAPKLLHYHEHGMPPGYSTGLVGLDKCFMVVPGEYSTWTGMPGHGKSEIVDFITVNLAVQYDWSVGYFTPENQPFEMHLSKLIEKIVAKPFHKDMDNRVTSAEINRVKGFLKSHFFYVMPERPNIDAILELVQALVTRNGIRAFVLDPWNWLEGSRQEWMSETEHVSICLTKIKMCCLNYGIHIFLVAHPSKVSKDKSGEYPVPKMYDIAGSAHFFNKTDFGLSVWRDVKNGGCTEVHIQKVKNKIYGKIDMVSLEYNKWTGQYWEGSGQWTGESQALPHYLKLIEQGRI